MTEVDPDKERGRSSSERQPKRKSLLVNPRTLKVMLKIGPWVATAIRTVFDLVKLFKE